MKPTRPKSATGGIERGDRLVEAMHARGIFKQHALAHRLGVTESTITRWKKTGAMSVEHAIMLCEVLSINLDWLLCGIGPMDRFGAGDKFASYLKPDRGGFEELQSAFLDIAQAHRPIFHRLRLAQDTTFD